MNTFQRSRREPVTPGLPDAESDYTCSICQDIFNKPTRINCGHVFCQDCLSDNAQSGDSLCPLCRESYNMRNAFYDYDLEQTVKAERGTCPNCNLLMTLHQLKRHRITCTNRQAYKFKPVAPTKQAPPKPDENRSTFLCPYCPEKNLTCQALIKHCSDLHSSANPQVVCPVCAAMPWGDPTLKSSNFMQHLTMRHKFEYETYVDYQVDDDEMLRKAIMASMQDQ